jgi:signal transduction histidine kinase
MVMAPIKSRDDVMGLLVLGHRDKNHFTPEDREMATALASQAAAAIDHAQTFEELKWRQRVNQMEARIATIAASSLDLDAMLDGICREAVIAMKASRVSVWLQDAPGTLRRAAAAGAPLPAEASLRALPAADAVTKFQLGHALTMEQSTPGIPAAQMEAALRFGITDCITVPFGQQGRLVGLLVLSLIEPGARFQPSDLELAEAITRQAQLAIANALAYRDQQRAIQRLDELNRTKTSFLSTMRHELRTPLNAILGFSDLLQKRVAGELTPKQDHYIDNIRQGGEQLLRLVDDILEYARVQSAEGLEHESVALPLLLRDVVASFGSLPESKGLTVTVETAPDLPPVSADPVRLGRAVRHLLDNAIKFSDSGGKVTVAAAVVGREMEVRVADQGPGIPAEEQEHIFAPFVQGDSSMTRRHQGTGLGLAMVSRIVELHGGSVTVESQPGQGSTFSIRLPLPEGGNP